MRLLRVARALLITSLSLGTAAHATHIAFANGRIPATVGVQHIPGDSKSILLPVTFGLLISDDDGANFRWICEKAVGYDGVFDPHYALEADGALWATTFDGLRVTRDKGCTWTDIGGPLAGRFVGDVQIASDGIVWAATSAGGEANDIFKSSGPTTFVATGLNDGMAWWRTLRIAPSDPARVYVSGFRPSEPIADSDARTAPEALAYKTQDGGASWQRLSLSGVTFGTVPQFDILGVAADNPDVVWGVAVSANDPIGDLLYVSTDAGANWSEILAIRDSIQAFLAEVGTSGYELRVGTINDGNRTSLDSGLNWKSSTSPRMTCISRRSDGTYFACGSNWEPDFFALGRSSDAVNWNKVVRFSEIAGPVSCPAGTVQFDFCELQRWPDLATSLGIGVADAGPGGDGDAAMGPDGGMVKKPDGGCCDSGAGASGSLLLTTLLLLGFAYGSTRHKRTESTRSTTSRN